MRCRMPLTPGRLSFSFSRQSVSVSVKKLVKMAFLTILTVIRSLSQARSAHGRFPSSDRPFSSPVVSRPVFSVRSVKQIWPASLSFLQLESDFVFARAPGLMSVTRKRSKGSVTSPKPSKIVPVAAAQCARVKKNNGRTVTHQKSTMDSPVSVGTRVSVDGYYGTVRFYGSVKGTQGTWLGVEWDDSTRGKHNGCYNGAQYFKTRHATGGSFVRPSKADLGISVREAIKMKYLNHETDEKRKKEISENSTDVWLLGNVGNTQSNLKCIEFVGPEKISELQSRQELLRIVNLRNMPVSSAGREITSVAPMIVELDLSHTLLSHWDSVALIAQQLPHLTELNLGKNHLQVPSLVTKHQDAFQSVRRISLEASNLTWEHILQLAPMWPHIESLEVSANNISTLSTPPKTIFGNLEALSLQENPLTSWQEVAKLANLPKLRELYLNGCRIEKISFPSETGEKTEQFSKLERFEVANNRLSSWKSVAELEKLSSLRVLRINGNPTTCGTFEDVFYDIIGRLSVTNINRMDVCKETRKEAELYYLKKHFPEYQRLKEGENHCSEFLQSHPRFQKLLEVYGEPTITVTDSAPTTLKSTLIALEFVAIDEPAVEPIPKKVPSSMTLGNLKRMVNVMFKRKPARKPTLTYFPTNGRFGDTGLLEYDFGNDLRDLNFYDIEDGDKIYARW